MPDLLDRIPADQHILCDTADGAFGTCKCHDAIATRSAAATIPPGKTAKLPKAQYARRDRKRRSPARITPLRSNYLAMKRASPPELRETKIYRAKLIGHRMAATDFDLQVAEFQVRIAVLNGFTALGIPVTGCKNSLATDSGVHPSTDLCNKAHQSQTYSYWTRSTR